MPSLLLSVALLVAATCLAAILLRARGRTGASRRERTLADLLLGALADRDPDLGAHSCDVASAAIMAAHRLGLRGAAARQVGLAAELHDVGKLAIPDRILSKPGPLDSEEWDIMRMHAEIGGRMLAALPALAPAAALVRASHERHDGGGYPLALCGDQIPLGARIIAVCDAYDAMTTQRVYNRPVTPAVGLERLRAAAGSQFDPMVVNVVCTVIEEMLGAGARSGSEPTALESHAAALQPLPSGTLFA